MVVISGAHTQIWSKDAEADRAFLRDVLGLPSTGGHWPIFGLPPSSIAVHPSEDSERHEVYFLCDDVEAFIAEMTAKGIECSPAKDVGACRAFRHSDSLQDSVSSPPSFSRAAARSPSTSQSTPDRTIPERRGLTLETAALSAETPPSSTWVMRPRFDKTPFLLQNAAPGVLPCCPSAPSSSVFSIAAPQPPSS
mmetsp:Transcript_23952/g.73789  ORF Transcript_23952/g.73789 Transcript_23952/m.73789 type:complete len:194 (-) Transcript_23952:25-606(-)